MKIYYALSQMKEKNVLTHLRGINAILINDLNDIKKENFNIQYLSDVDDSKDFIYLVTTNFNQFNFSIRGTVDEMYIVSKEFLDLLKLFKVNLKKKINLHIVNHKDYAKVIKDKYYLIAFNQVSFRDVVDLDKSNIYQEFPVTIDGIEKIVIKKGVEQDFFIIEELNGYFKTPICSKSFKQDYEKLGLKGVKFLSLDENIRWEENELNNDYLIPI